MNSTVPTSLVAAGVGAAVMFLFDPARGNRRRALMRDKMARLRRRTKEAAGATRRDLQNRWEGAAASLQSQPTAGGADDRVICERVRAELGRVASHPRAIEVSVVNGSVKLSGDALAAEVPAIVNAAGDVRGVLEVQNHMTAHPTSEGIPALQGRWDRPDRWSTLRSGWSPTAKLAASAGAATIAFAIAARRSM